MKRLAAILIVGGLLASGCGDDGSSDGDLAAFCDAADRLEQAEPFDHVDDREAYEAELDEMESAMADARSNAPSEISDAVEQASQDAEDVVAALRSIEDPSDEAEVEATLMALDDTATGVTSGSEIDVYLVENCDSPSSGDSTDDASSDGDLAAFCDAIDRLDQSGDPWDHVDDRDAFQAELDEQAAAWADIRSNAPPEISDAIEQGADEMEDAFAVLRSIEDPSDEAEVEAAAAALDDGGTGVTGGIDLDAYIAENCGNGSGDSE